MKSSPFPVSSFRLTKWCGWLTLIFLFTSTFTFGQINPDQKYVKKNKIKSATFEYADSYAGIVLHFDDEGRLIRSVQYEWWPFNSEQKGQSYVTEFDTLNRWTLSSSYELNDSLHLKNPEEFGYPMSVSRWYYYGDTLEIRLDTSRDYSNRIVEVHYDETKSEWAKMPPPPKLRSPYYADEYLASQLNLRRTSLYYYKNDTALTPYFTNELGGVTMLSVKLTEDRLTFYSLGDSYFGDSMMRYSREEYHTLHGHRDTLFSDYRLTIIGIKDTTPVQYHPPKSYYAHVVSKKRFGKYIVKFNLGGNSRQDWNKLKLKEPWNDSQFCYGYVRSSQSFPADTYYTIEFMRKEYRCKPIYTYW